MVKKIKKYVKFVVCMALIMGLIAPSYAALSASDGSAFVTKAEFDSALADFNARLTTFEAGINSKIDSQVTSYLDRNGIWNGKDQQLDWCHHSFTQGGNSNIRWALIIGNSADNHFIADEYYLEVPTATCVDWASTLGLSGAGKIDMSCVMPAVVKFTANKSGLLNWNYCGNGGGAIARPHKIEKTDNTTAQQMLGYTYSHTLCLLPETDGVDFLGTDGSWVLTKTLTPIDSVDLVSVGGQGRYTTEDTAVSYKQWSYAWDLTDFDRSSPKGTNDLYVIQPYAIDCSLNSHPRYTFVTKNTTYYLCSYYSWSIYVSKKWDTGLKFLWWNYQTNTNNIRVADFSKLPQWQWKVY